MEYVKEETLYGPEIRFNDWRVESGTADRGGGVLRLIGNPEGEVVRNDYPYGGGGDVEVSIAFAITPAGPDPEVVCHFNFVSSAPDSRGERVRLGSKDAELRVPGHEAVSFHHRGLGRDTVHRLRLVTLDERYALWYADELIASGRMNEPFVDNEGWFRLTARNAVVRIEAFEESAVRRDVEVPGWKRVELLYREEFHPASFDRFWVCNREAGAPPPTLGQGGYRFRHMSNSLLRERFDGPIAVDYVARPVESDEHTAGVTDAIFLWMAEAPEDDLVRVLEQKSEEGVASLSMLLPYRFYWVDFGGTNNVTTRLRKNPYRHLMRQYTDRGRLLRRNHTYRITCIANGPFIEFHVDGVPMMKLYDPNPYTAGHVGIRCFVSDLELTGLEVHRIGS